jgi:hypothetical protein
MSFSEAGVEVLDHRKMIWIRRSDLLGVELDMSSKQSKVLFKLEEDYMNWTGGKYADGDWETLDCPGYELYKSRFFRAPANKEWTLIWNAMPIFAEGGSDFVPDDDDIVRLSECYSHQMFMKKFKKKKKRMGSITTWGKGYVVTLNKKTNT